MLPTPQSQSQQTHRRRPRANRSKSRKPSFNNNGNINASPQQMHMQSPASAPLAHVLIDASLGDHMDKHLLDGIDHFLIKSSNKSDKPRRRSHKRGPSFRRNSTSASQSYHRRHPYCCSSSCFYSCCDYTGCNFLLPALSIWFLILVFFWYPELKDNSLDYYYLRYPEQQPLSPIPGTVLPLLPNVWLYDPPASGDSNSNSQAANDKGKTRQRNVQNHLRQHKQPHYYMLPQDYYDQQPPSEQTTSAGDGGGGGANRRNNGTDDATDSNTALEAPKIRGILIVLHNCHQSGLHFFQLPESRIVAARALQRGLAIFSPTASTASTLLTTPSSKGGNPADAKSAMGIDGGGGGGDGDSIEKNCWSASLDGDELLGPLLYEWAKELKLGSLPRMGMGVSNGANLLVKSSLYKTMRLQSMALYASHNPKGFDLEDLERDVVPATAFIVYPKGDRATTFAIQNHNTLLAHTEEEEAEDGVHKDEQDNDPDEGEESDVIDFKKSIKRKAHIFQVEPHPWTATLCQGRLPEYHTRCRSFFRYVQKYQKNRVRKQEEKQMKQDPQQRAKRQRLGGGYAKLKQRHQLLSSVGDVLQSSKNVQWNSVLQSLGLDDWTTHTMAFTLASNGARTKGQTKRQKKKKSQLMQFPTTATPEGRSWLWASMLQEIEVSYGLQEMTSEHSPQILDFLMYHAGLSI